MLTFFIPRCPGNVRVRCQPGYTHTQTDMYIYIYVYRIYVCMFMFIFLYTMPGHVLVKLYYSHVLVMFSSCPSLSRSCSSQIRVM